MYLKIKSDQLLSIPTMNMYTSLSTNLHTDQYQLAHNTYILRQTHHTNLFQIIHILKVNIHISIIYYQSCSHKNIVEIYMEFTIFISLKHTIIAIDNIFNKMKFPVFSLIFLLIFKFPVFSLILNKIFKFPDFSLQGIFFSHFPCFSLSVGTLFFPLFASFHHFSTLLATFPHLSPLFPTFHHFFPFPPTFFQLFPTFHHF